MKIQTLCFRASHLWIVALACALNRLPAAPENSAPAILFGQSAVFTGRASALGLGMRAGIEACFAQVNNAGGIGGRQVKLVAKDDGYEPERAAGNTRELIETNQVLVLLGAVGTPTA